MSIVNDDRKVTESKKRKNKLENIEASLRDQCLEKLVTKLEDMKMGEKVVQLWNKGNILRADWLNRQQTYLADWDEFMVSTADGPFKGSSTLHLPMPLIVAKTLHARFLQALLGIEPAFQVKSRTEAFVERTQLVQDVMAYTLKDWINYRQGIYQAVDLWVWDWITTGCGILKARWAQKYTRFTDVRTVPKSGKPKIQLDQNGKEVTVPTIEMVEEEFSETKTCFAGPCLEDVRAEDLLLLGGAGDPQLADAVIHRERLTASELWTYADKKIFKSEQVKEVIQSGKDHMAGSLASAIKIERALDSGKSVLDSDAELDRYEILEAYLKVDVDESGIDSDIVLWVHTKSARILRATYLYRINKAGERPFSKIDYYKRAGQDYGIGILEILHPLSIELDAIHNMRIDFGILATMPFGFYRPTSSINPTTIQIEPGALIPVDNPQTDIYFPNLGNRTAMGFQEEAAIQTLVERLTGINDLSLGVLTGAQGATRTATGTRALLGESNANLDVFLRRLNLGWTQVLKYLLHMLQQRIPVGLSFRVTGESGDDYWKQIQSAKDIEGDYDFEISANSANSNSSIQQEIAEKIYQATANPLDIQLGIITPLERYEAVKNYLKTMGIKDFGKYIKKPQGIKHILSPEEEANRILRGVSVDVGPESDHDGFQAYYEEIYKSDELLGQFSEEQAKQLAIHAAKHQRMAQALKQMQAQQANTQQMRINAQQSQQQSNPGLNPVSTPKSEVGSANG